MSNVNVWWQTRRSRRTGPLVPTRSRSARERGRACAARVEHTRRPKESARSQRPCARTARARRPPVAGGAPRSSTRQPWLQAIRAAAGANEPRSRRSARRGVCGSHFRRYESDRRPGCRRSADRWCGLPLRSSTPPTPGAARSRSAGCRRPTPPEGDAIPHARPGQMTAVASHELDNQVPVLLGVVRRGEQAAIRGVQPDVDVQITVRLVSDHSDGSGGMPTRAQHGETARVVDAVESMCSRRADIGARRPRLRLGRRCRGARRRRAREARRGRRSALTAGGAAPAAGDESSGDRQEKRTRHGAGIVRRFRIASLPVSASEWRGGAELIRQRKVVPAFR